MVAGIEETHPAIFILIFDQSNDGGLGGSGLLGTVAPALRFLNRSLY